LTGADLSLEQKKKQKNDSKKKSCQDKTDSSRSSGTIILIAFYIYSIRPSFLIERINEKLVFDLKDLFFV
jgi:hypothetical protein